MSENQPIEICILAGEKSGDSHATLIIEELKKYYPQAIVYGTGGDSMQQTGAEIITHIQNLAMMGLSGVTRVLPNVIKTYFILKKRWQKKPPAFIVPVDYGGFNLKMCKLAKKLNIPIYYYIPPKIWAWNQKRVHTLRKTTNKVFVINPFELDFYTKHNVNAVYAGNPSAYEIANYSFNSNFKKKYNLQTDKKLVGIFPGSRRKEVEKLTPIFLEAATNYYQKYPNTEFVICCPSTINTDIYQPFLQQTNLPIQVIKDDNLNLMKNADFLILKSGTTTLEAGLIGTPMVVCYIIDLITYLFVKTFANIKFISLVNLNLNRAVVKEFVQKDVNADNILKEMESILHSDNFYTMQNQLLTLKTLLNPHNPAIFVAKAIYEDFEVLRKSKLLK